MRNGKTKNGKKLRKDDEASDWIEELAVQRKTLYSNALLVETDDIKRIEKLLDERPAMAKPRKGLEKWYVLDAWEGLSEVITTEKLHIERIPVEGLNENIQSYDISQSLPEISKMLYEGKVVLVITNVFRTDEKLNRAIRGWATSEILREKSSTVIVFADDRSMLPSEVWSHMKIIKPPKSTWMERHAMIYDNDRLLDKGEELSDEDISNAVRLTSGMNLDQLEAAIIESIILSGGISIDALAHVKKEILAKNPVVEIIEQPKFGFEAVGGYDTLKERIMDSIVLPMKNEEISERFGIQPPRGILLFGPPGCFVKGTLVTLADGTLKRIEDFGKYHGQEINENIKNISDRGVDKAIQYHIYEEVSCYVLETETGRKVKCSYNQPFWTKDGWKDVDKLKINDKIQVAVKYKNRRKEYVTMRPKNLYSKEKTSKEYVLDEDLALLFGYAFGDGNIRFRHKPKKPYEVNIVINEEEQDIIPKLVEICKNKFGIEPKKRIKKAEDGEYKERKIKRKQDMTYLQIHNLEIGSLFYFLHKKKKQRIPPEEILQSPKSVVSAFLKGYYEADGSCRGFGRGQGKHNSVDMKSSNPKTLEIIQLLLLQYAIKARIYENNISIQRAEDIRKFGKEIGFLSKKKKKKLEKIIKNLPTKRTNKASRYEKIKSITKVENETVYDITTKSKHFIANGIKVHNTGKTLLIKSMAKELNMSIIRIMPEKIKGKYVGESEKSMRKVFDIADAMSPCIVFVDEFDRLSKRDSGPQTSSNVDRELFSMLLEKLGDENRQWFFAAATNLIEAIDPAMRRTGRIDSVAPVPYPDEKAREEILKIHMTVKRQMPIGKGIDIKNLAKRTYMWSGSDIEQLVVRTAQYALKEAVKNNQKDRMITKEDFETILETFNIDIEENKKVQKKIENQAIKYTNDKRLKDVFEHAEKIQAKSKISKVKEMLDNMEE